MEKSAAVLCVYSGRLNTGTLLDRLRQAGHKVCAVSGLSSGISAPEFDCPQVVLLEQKIAEDLFELARSLWPQAAIVQFDSHEQDDGVLRRIQSALE
jgi:nucleoside-diphosphate-sugar epimerase